MAGINGRSALLNRGGSPYGSEPQRNDGFYTWSAQQLARMDSNFCTRVTAARLSRTFVGAPNKTYDNPSAFNASCTFGRAFMRSMKALTFGKGERSNSTRGAQRVTV